MTREEIIQALREGVCIINRRLFTLNEDYLGTGAVTPADAFDAINDTVSDDQIMAVDVYNAQWVVIPIDHIESFQKV